MKKLLLIALMAYGLAFVPAQRSDAQVSVGIGGVGVGFGYPAYRYSYYRTTDTTGIATTAIIGTITTIGTKLT
jgi:hypothetical protein